MSQNEAFEYKQSGNQNLNKDNFDQAIADFTKAINLNPNDAESYLCRGIAYYGIGVIRDDPSSLDRAIEDLDHALKLNPDYEPVYTSRGGVYLFKNECDKALEDFNRAIQLDPKDYYAYTGRGNTYVRKKEYERGIKDLEAAQRINPNIPDAGEFIEMARMRQRMQI